MTFFRYMVKLFRTYFCCCIPSKKSKNRIDLDDTNSINTPIIGNGVTISYIDI